MTTGTENWEIAKVEYDNAVKQCQLMEGLRRQDMMFTTTVQAAILTIIGVKATHLDLVNFLLTGIAFFVLVLGLNSERRIAKYTAVYMQRAREIESEYGMSLLSLGKSEVQKRKLLFSNSLLFPLYYLIFILAWLIVWLMNWIH